MDENLQARLERLGYLVDELTVSCEDRDFARQPAPLRERISTTVDCLTDALKELNEEVDATLLRQPARPNPHPRLQCQKDGRRPVKKAAVR
jgi:hypothetical protein